MLRAALDELLGLFIDDWAFALGLLFWVGALALVGRRLPSVWGAVLFFLGLAMLTLVVVVRKARALRPPR